jgi:hypothetical protein
MRVQEISTGGTIQNDDMLFGSQFIEKGKFRNLNFNIKDIINYVKAGLPASSGTLSIQIGEQDADSPYLTPTELINRSVFNIDVPAYGLLFIKMKKNKDGLCDELYLFLRNGFAFGENAMQCKEADFLKLFCGGQKQNEFTHDSYEEFNLSNTHNKGLIWCESPEAINIPDNLTDDFTVQFFNVSNTTILLIPNPNIDLDGTELNERKIYTLKRRSSDKKFFLIH